MSAHEIISFEGNGTLQPAHDGRLWIVTTQALTRPHVDAMFEKVEGIFQKLSAHEPLGLLFDATHDATTPYFRQCMMQVNTMAVALPNRTRIACVVQEQYRGELSVLANLTGSGQQHQLRVFTDKDSALAWAEKDLI